MRNPIRAAFDECERLSVEDRICLAELYSKTLTDLSETVRLAGRSDLQPILADLAEAMSVAARGIASDSLGTDILLEAGCLIVSIQGIVKLKPQLRVV